MDLIQLSQVHLDPGRSDAMYLGESGYRPLRAFTLIELLIVIAIILILIAIALPNFLEAQIRAKVTNASAEMRSVKIALISYGNDRRFYPADIMEQGVSIPGPSHSWTRSIQGWKQLSTPTAYMKTIPQDRFLNDPYWTPSKQAEMYYRYMAMGWRCGCAGVSIKKGKCIVPPNVRGVISFTTPFDPDRTYIGNFTILSDGPDRTWNFGEWLIHRLNFESKNLLYSPTNGTTSAGDLVVWGPS
jgi:prepilin-type N-terminal cleavage/methylation domain-containing protein